MRPQADRQIGAARAVAGFAWATPRRGLLWRTASAQRLTEEHHAGLLEALDREGAAVALSAGSPDVVGEPAAL